MAWMGPSPLTVHLSWDSEIPGRMCRPPKTNFTVLSKLSGYKERSPSSGQGQEDGGKHPAPELPCVPSSDRQVQNLC